MKNIKLLENNVSSMTKKITVYKTKLFPKQQQIKIYL